MVAPRWTRFSRVNANEHRSCNFLVHRRHCRCERTVDTEKRGISIPADAIQTRDVWLLLLDVSTPSNATEPFRDRYRDVSKSGFAVGYVASVSEASRRSRRTTPSRTFRARVPRSETWPRVNVPVIVNRDAKDNHAREIPFAPYVTMDLIILARDRGKMDSIPTENSILKGGGVEIILTTGQHTFVELQTCLEAKFQIIPLFQSNFQLIKVRASNPISFSLNLLPISD